MTGERRIVRVTVGGLVQGVGYRAWTEAQAGARGIDGWVRNRLNGDVEALFAGPPDAVEALCALCRRGPPGARVAKIEIREESAAALAGLAAERGFRQLATR